MDTPMDPAVLEKKALEARVAELERENEDLWQEVNALSADLNVSRSFTDKVFGYISAAFGFSPKTPEEASRLVRFACDVAMEDDEFKSERDKQLKASRDRVRKAMRRNREYRDAEAEVERIRREMNSIEKAKRVGQVMLDDRLDDVKQRLNTAAERLEKMREELP